MTEKILSLHRQFILSICHAWIVIGVRKHGLRGIREKNPQKLDPTSRRDRNED
jgi:hypothetical protein